MAEHLKAGKKGLKSRMRKITVIPDSIEFPDSHCCKSDNHAHHFLYIGDEIWMCKYCFAIEWQPTLIEEAQIFGNYIRHKGVQWAYKIMLKKKPEVRSHLKILSEYIQGKI